MSSAAALAVHVGVVLAIPDAPAESAVTEVNLVWLSAASDASQGGSGRASPTGDTDGAKPAAGRVKASAASRRARSTRRAAPAPLSSSAAAETQEDVHTPSVAPSEPTVHDGEHTTAGAFASAAGAGGERLGPAGGASGGAPRDGASGVGYAGVLAHGPSLLSSGNPCRGFFPAAAAIDHAAVRISVEVDSAGHARASRVLAESPGGQHFRQAAQACAAALRFAPAADLDGSPIAGVAKLELRFDRS